MKRLILVAILVVGLVGGLVPAGVVGAGTSQTWHLTAEEIGTANIAPPLMISEIQTDSTTGTGGSADDYIELYNPTDANVNLETSGYRLERWTSGGTKSIVMRFGNTSDGTYNNVIIPAHGFYLVVDDDATDTTLKGNADALVTKTFALGDDSAVGLGKGAMDGPGDDDTVDFVGWGTNALYELAAAPNPVEGQSIERKAGSDSNETDMAAEGSHYSWGNGEDTDDNSNYFILKTSPEPQNSQDSLIEVYPTKANDSPASHVIDGVMSKSGPGDTSGSGAILGGTGGNVLWWYPEYPAQYAVHFGEDTWTANVDFSNTGNTGNLTVEIFTIASTDGYITSIAQGTADIGTGSAGTANISCSDNPSTTQTVSVGNRFGVRLSWNQPGGTPITIRFGSDHGSYLTSPSSDPQYPFPELSIIILFGLGLMVVGAVIVRERRKIPAECKVGIDEN